MLPFPKRCCFVYATGCGFEIVAENSYIRQANTFWGEKMHGIIAYY